MKALFHRGFYIISVSTLAFAVDFSIPAQAQEDESSMENQGLTERGSEEGEENPSARIDDEPVVAGPPLSYTGVTVQGGEPPKLAVPAPPPGKQYVTWPGFKRTDKGTEIFVQLTGPVEYSQKRKGGKVLVTMENVIVPLKNNFRPILTGNFPGAVRQFRLRAMKRSRVILEISLRKQVKHVLDLKSGGPYSFLVVNFADANL